MYYISMFFIKKKTDSFKHNMKFLTSIDKYQIDIKGSLFLQQTVYIRKLFTIVI